MHAHSHVSYLCFVVVIYWCSKSAHAAVVGVSVGTWGLSTAIALSFAVVATFWAFAASIEREMDGELDL